MKANASTLSVILEVEKTLESIIFLLYLSGRDLIPWIRSTTSQYAAILCLFLLNQRTIDVLWFLDNAARLYSWIYSLFSQAVNTLKLLMIVVEEPKVAQMFWKQPLSIRAAAAVSIWRVCLHCPYFTTHPLQVSLRP